jgi:hypothetical protein
MDEVIEISAPEDGLVFDSQSLSVEETQIDADYQGIRVKLIALLERTRIPIQIDIGFSDELASKAESIEYPNILPDLENVHMKGYPKGNRRCRKIPCHDPSRRLEQPHEGLLRSLADLRYL